MMISVLVFLLIHCLMFSMQRAAISHQQGSHCNSKDCERNAERVNYLIDNSVDPCDDFFQYACNSNKRGKEFPYAREEVTQNLTELIEEAAGEFSFLKDFYDSCVSITSKFSTEQVAEYCTHDGKCTQEELKKFGIVYPRFREKALNVAKQTLPPVLTDDWESKYENYTWQKLSEDVLRHEYYLGAFQFVDKENTEKFFSNVFFAPMIDHSVNGTLFNSLRNQYTSQLHIVPMTFPEFLVNGSFQDLEEYKQLMITSMKMLGQMNVTLIEEDMAKVLDNEIKLAKLSKSEYSFDIRTNSDGKNNKSEKITLDEMNKLFPSCNWIEFVNSVMENSDVKVNGSEIVVIPGKERLVKMYKLINELPKREQANLMFWRILAKFSVNFLKTGVEEGAIYKNIFDTNGKRTSRSENCVNQIKIFFPRIVDDLIINKYLQPGEKEQIQEIFQLIKDEFEDIINNSEWLSEETQIAAIRKLKKMKINIGDLHNNVDHIPETLSKLKKDDYLNNLSILGNSFWKNQVENLRTPKDPFDREGEDNASYEDLINQVQINVGLTKGTGIGFSKSLPRALVYGGFVASTLGHELMHGFDKGGIDYDENGLENNWWDPKSREEFTKRVECMKQQYTNFTFNVGYKTYRVNGSNTINENIADNGGVKISYRAFIKANRAEKEIMPPGLNLTSQQLFWVGYAQDWCLLSDISATFEETLNYEGKDVHAPAPWRVNTVLSNQQKFAEDFECPLGSKLNPVDKCIVW